MPLTKGRYEYITNKLEKMCAQDSRLISIVKGRGLKDFCNALNPAYKVLVHVTVEAHLKLEYGKKKDELISKLKEQDVAFTTDLWSSLGK